MNDKPINPADFVTDDISLEDAKAFFETAGNFEIDEFNDAKRFKATGVQPEPENDESLTVYYRLSEDTPPFDVIVITDDSTYSNENPGQICIDMFNTTGTYKDTKRILIDRKPKTTPQTAPTMTTTQPPNFPKGGRDHLRF
jgi:hypothetical protein